MANTAFTLMGKVGSYAGGLIVTPIVLRALGVEAFGLWTLVVILSGQFGLLDLGFGAALTKHVAEFDACKTPSEINRPFTVALGFYCLVSAAVAAGLAAFPDPLLRFFSVPPVLWHEAMALLPLTALVFLLSSVVGMLQSVINGLQRMHVTNAIAVGQVIAMVLMTVVSLRLGQGLPGVMAALLGSLALAAVALAVFAKRALPSLALTLAPTGPHERRIYTFGATVQLARISGIVVAYSDRVLIAHFLSLQSLAEYQLGYTVIGLMRGFGLIFGPAIVPAASAMAAAGNSQGLRALYRRGTKYSLVMAVGMTGFIVALAPMLTRAWLGYDDALVVQVIRLLAFGHAFHIVTGLGTSICEGIGKAGMEARFGMTLALLQVCLGLVGVTIFGLQGLLLGTTIAMAVASAIFLLKFHLVMERGAPPGDPIPVGNVLLSVLPAAASCLLASAALARFIPHYPTLGPLPLVVCSALFAALYVITLQSTGCIDDLDRSLVSRLLPGVRPGMSRVPSPRM
jgi:O-antigen/teichoic acid export membrane protein